jgi:hypothetical protein
MNVVLINIIIVFSAWAWAAHGSPFLVEENAQDTTPQQIQLVRELDRAYEYITSPVAVVAGPQIVDAIDRKQCPIQIHFQNLNGRSGFTPNPAHQVLCNDVIELDTSLRNNAASSVVVAHELTHLLRHQANANETAWIDEGLAQVIAMQFDHRWPKEKLMMLQSHDTSFTIETDLERYAPNSAAYKNAFLLMHYLVRHLGRDEFIRALMHSEKSGWDAITSVAKQTTVKDSIGISADKLNSVDLWTRFAFALRLNDLNTGDCGLFEIDDHYTAESAITIQDANRFQWPKTFSIGYYKLLKPLRQNSVLMDAWPDLTARKIQLYALKISTEGDSQRSSRDSRYEERSLTSLEDLKRARAERFTELIAIGAPE